MYFIKVDFQLVNNKRKRPLVGDTYRPIFYLGNNILRSGLIIIEKDEALFMDQFYKNRTVGIYFYKDIDYKNIFSVGAKFEMCEGSATIGFGEIVEVIGEEDFTH